MFFNMADEKNSILFDLSIDHTKYDVRIRAYRKQNSHKGETMTNAKLKSLIEKTAAVKIKTTCHKCDAWEGYASVYKSDVKTFKLNGSTRFNGPSFLDFTTFGSRTRSDATTRVLLKVAAELGVTVANECNDMEQNRANADFNART